MDNKLIFIIYICYLAIMSLITLFLFIKDKKIAKSGDVNRIKEKTLLGFIAYGGAIGGFLGRIIAHHKTDKIYFTITIFVALLLQILCAACLALYAYGIIKF